MIQKIEIKISHYKDFIINLFKVNDKNNSGVVKINQTMSKLLTLNKCLQLN